MTIPYKQIRAVYDAKNIRVYQAYGEAIALPALKHQRFVAPFKMSRMTWIKPSFLWMMYRAGYGFKDDGQAYILAIDMRREGFDWALNNSCASTLPQGMGLQEWQKYKEKMPVRVQWDPERDLRHQPLAHRSIQVGLSEKAVQLYVEEWVTCITDITPLAHEIYGLVQQNQLDAAKQLLPDEREYTPMSMDKNY